jgi:hypothetical protein
VFLGCEFKDWYRLSEISKMLKTDEDLQDIREEFKAELMKDLLQHRATKTQGAHTSNASATADSWFVVKKIAEEVYFFLFKVWLELRFELQITNLYERASMYGFAILSKGHVQDKSIPYALHSADSLEFIHKVLNLNPLDLVTMFEQWTCAQKKGTLVFVFRFHMLILWPRNYRSPYPGGNEEVVHHRDQEGSQYVFLNVKDANKH